MYNGFKDALVAWVDFETDGIEEPLPLEVAVVVTDTDLAEVSRFSTPIMPFDVVVADRSDLESVKDARRRWVDRTRETANEHVQQMHDRTGLWDEVVWAGRSVKETDRLLTELVGEALSSTGRGPDDRVVLAGSGVERFDRPLLMQEWFPSFDSLLYYSAVDVASIRNFYLAFAPDLMPQSVQDHLALPPEHRALSDVEYHIETTRLLRQGLRDVER